MFHLRLNRDVVETYWWDIVITSPWDVVTTYQQDVLKTYHRDVLATFHWDVVGCFIWNVPATSLGRTERRRYDVTTTSCCRVGLDLNYNSPFSFWKVFKSYFYQSHSERYIRKLFPKPSQFDRCRRVTDLPESLLFWKIIFLSVILIVILYHSPKTALWLIARYSIKHREWLL